MLDTRPSKRTLLLTYAGQTEWWKDELEHVDAYPIVTSWIFCFLSLSL